MPTTEQIIQTYNNRRKRYEPRFSQMRAFRDAVNGDMAIPLPELNRNEKPIVANLLAQGLDQTATRVSSTMPGVYCAPLRPGIEVSEEKARTRRLAILGWWADNRLNLVQRKRARFLLGYGSAPVILRPNFQKRIPEWTEADPLTVYPPPGDDLTPTDYICVYRKAYGWLTRQYPEAAATLFRSGSRPANPDTEFEVLEYADAEIHALIALGPVPTQGDGWTSPQGTTQSQTRAYTTLERFPNRTGLCPAVIPSRINLDRQSGQFDGLLGLYWHQAKLMALGTIAAQRDIFPDEWLESRPNEVAQIMTPADGQLGIVGQISGGQIRTTHSTPGSQTISMINILERAMRLTGEIPAEMTGESQSNVRTARRGQQILSAAVDFAIQEAQEILAAGLEEENRRAIAIDRAWFGNEEKSFWVSWRGQSERMDYVPNKVFSETDQNVVKYSFPGSDINSTIIGMGQRIGMGTLSKVTAMSLDPMVDDPEQEKARVTADGLETAFMASLQTQASQGGLPPADLARIIELVESKRMPLYKAVQKAQEEAQRRQAPEEAPVAPTSPEAQPGLAQPGMGQEAGVIAPPNSSQTNLASLLSSLRRPAMTLSSEQ